MARIKEKDAKSKLTSISATTDTKNKFKQVSALTNRPVYIIAEELISKELARLSK
jgi:hypothetical protein